MRALRLLCTALVLAGGAAKGHAQIVRTTTTPAEQAGVVVGYVTAATTGAPLGYADVAVTALGRAALADQHGRFVIAGLPVGAVELRVRRLGFTPVVVRGVVRADGADTLRVALQALALHLDGVRVSAAVCPQGRQQVDSAVVAILQQVQINAERSALLARNYPYVSTVERSFSKPQVVNPGDPISPRRQVARVDTIAQPSAREWRYAPGRIVVREGDAAGSGAARSTGAAQQFVIPELGDLADPPFVDTHCFRYAGLMTLDGRRMLRVDFEPSSAVTVADVSGSLFLDTLTYQLRRATLRHERRDPERSVLVESWFREFRSGLPVLDSVVGRVTSRSSARVSSAGARGRTETVNIPMSVIQTEAHRLLSVRFVGASPEGDTAFTVRTTATRLSVEGVAFDSLHLRALDGAAVQMDDPQHVTRTDSSGRFTFDEVTAGAHRFELRHPMLSSLGLAGVGATVNISGEMGNFAIATPSFGQLWRMLCGVRRVPTDSGFVTGTLLDARSRLPVDGVVMLTWTEARERRAEDGGGIRQWEGVLVDNDGRFAVCGVPTGTRLRLAAFTDSTASGPRTVMLDSVRTAIVPLDLGRNAPPPPATDLRAPADAAGPPGDPRSLIRTRLADLRRKDNQRRLETDPTGRIVTPRPFTADSLAIGAAGSWAVLLSRFDSAHVEVRNGRIQQVSLPKFQGHGTEMRLDATAGRCPAAIIVDRRALHPRFLDLLPLKEIAALEFYLGPDDVPPQFSAMSGECGVFVIWTKDVLF